MGIQSANISVEQENLRHDLLPIQPLQFAGMHILRFDREDSFQAVLAAAAEAPVRVAWIYANCVNILRRDTSYRKHLADFEFLLNDGAGVEIAAKLLKQPVRANLCGTDWIPELLTRLEQTNIKRVFLLGATTENIKAADQNFRMRWPKLELVGARHGYSNDNQETLKMIQASEPQVLIVGLGVPRQETFLTTYWPELQQAGVRIAVAGGAIVDHLAGAVNRAPAWMRKIRMEWFYRLITEPKRLWRRYLVGNTRFFIDLAREWWQRR